MQKEMIEALTETAKALLETRYPKIAESAEIDVRYFGRGNRFSVHRNPEDGVEIVLFFHAEEQPSNFSQIVMEAGAAAHRLLERRVSIRADVLRKLAANVNGQTLSAEEIEHVRSALQD